LERTDEDGQFVFSSRDYNSSNVFIMEGVKEYFFIFSINRLISVSDTFLVLIFVGILGLDEYRIVGNGVKRRKEVGLVVDKDEYLSKNK